MESNSYTLTIKKRVDGELVDVRSSAFDRREAGASMWADAAADICLQQLNAIPGCSKPFLDKLVDDVKDHVLALFESALKARSAEHYTIREKYLKVPVEVSHTESFRDDKGRLKGTTTVTFGTEKKA